MTAGDVLVVVALGGSVLASYYLGHYDGQTAATKRHMARLRGFLPKQRPTKTVEEDLAEELLREYETDGVQ